MLALHRIILTLATVLPVTLSAQQRPVDPFLWLEDVEGKRALDWVNAKNAATFAVLGKSPLYQPIFERIKQTLDSSEKIANPEIIGDMIYNFWQDAQHERGVWRRTPLEQYLGRNPNWETVLDIDALAKSENVPWAWKGADCLEPENRVCLFWLSRGGSDASEVREFDLVTKQFVNDGFKLPEAKSTAAWVDRNTLLVGTDFGPGSMTTSGYTRVLKLWKRGTPLSAATVVFEAQATDMDVWASAFDAGGRRYVHVRHYKTFYEKASYLYQDARLVKLDAPADADLYLVRDHIIVYVRDPWQLGATTWPTGAVVAMPVDDFIAGKRDFKLVFQPGPREAMNDFGITPTRDALLVNVLNNVRGELRKYRYQNGAWTFEKVPAPDLGTIRVAATSTSSNRFFFTYATFIQPTTLYGSDENGAVREVQRLPAMFNASGLVVQQLQATSKDGTKIPFFVVLRDGLARDGNNATLLQAYGGFEAPSLPSYNSTNGAAWLERGGVNVLANIRGGGEFGPQWHRAGLRENRQRIYDDFAAVAEELIRLRITKPERLGIMGSSNGGLLTGVAVTQRPELYNAAVLAVPLLDMQRYNHLLAGASWVAEYGNPDKPEDWAFLSKYSPYHNLKPNTKYPPVLFTTTTRDDRVHPGHARKMAAKMESMGLPFYYFENTEGGHAIGAGVTSEQRAKYQAIIYTYLWHQLGGNVPM